MDGKIYIAIDLKSFYASQECILRGLDPMRANLVVADESRTEKTICLAVSPALKAFGIPGRPRLFEVVEQVRKVNALRKIRAPGGVFSGTSTDAPTLAADPSLEVDYIVAPPRMGYYMECSARIYGIYLQYVAPEDMHVYSVDEVFIDATPYLKTYDLTPEGFAQLLISQIREATGITAAAGIGTNLFLCKVAMDIVAKHIPADANGVRIAYLDEASYRRLLWTHRPLTDFWRVGPGIARKLEKNGMFTMGDIARCSVGQDGAFHNEELLYKLFGVNAELLIDHAWGWEPCTIADIKAYKPEANSISSGQVLTEPYTFDKARLVVREMADVLSMDLLAKGIETAQLTLTVGYDVENLLDETRAREYRGPVTIDRYGRRTPKHGHGTYNLPRKTASTSLILQGFTELFDRIADPKLLVRRLTLCANDLTPEGQGEPELTAQLDLFSQPEQEEELKREKRRQQAVLAIRSKYGKNAILKGMNFQEGATTRDRNQQIGGHKA